MNKKRLQILLFLIGSGIIFYFPGKAQDRVTQLNTLFDSLAARQDFNGCILVAENGKPIFEKAVGYADLDKKVPNRISTRFELASVSKQFTAMAIMQLKEQGKLQYDDSLRQYFPALKFTGVTIRHLLNQTSGIPEVLAWNQQQLDTSRINGNMDIIQRLPNVYDSTYFKPGTAYRYSNTNYLLLAQIVEKVSGEKFADYMRRHVFLPAGMKNTLVYSRRSAVQPIPDYALGYIWDASANKFLDPDSTMSNSYTYYLDRIAGPFGICSNVTDLLSWDQALYTEKLVKKATLLEAYTPFPLKEGNAGLAPGLDYGFGWVLSAEPSKGQNVWHNGSWGGYNTLITRYIDHNKTIIILSNIDRLVNVMTLIPSVDDIVWGNPYSIPQKKPLPYSIKLPQEALDALAGVYPLTDNPALKMRINVKGNKVYATFGDQSAAEIYPESADTFFYTVVDAKLKFEKDPAGTPIKLTLYQNGREIIMTRGTK
ncbi:serine hydrolase domain-containing protein [Chitinophaga sp. 22321]|uniref:Serine hydrolase n=1 Tax=Chitinophaga hostae TaxID=2831022 RepID=A0ABS5J126_9BACT|nr:serine hydrolase domain-containing protein [Chitinophaga hostae]MBS0028916.1 serine hydrolase [Chitinophaga hostae]